MSCSACLKESSGESAARMSAVVNVLLMSFFLLHNAHCEDFSVSLPRQMEALRGSCLTIPCSFTVADAREADLNSRCRAEWREASSSATVVFTRQSSGDLTKKNCTSTVYGLTVQQSRDVQMRLACDNLQVTFGTKLTIKVKEVPPTPTLTPPTLSAREGQSVSVQCSAPVPCPSLPPTLTWSSVLGPVQETLQEQQDKTYVKVSTLRFTASKLKTGLSCSARYRRGDGTPAVSKSRQIMLDITYPPRNTRVTVSPPGSVMEHSDVTLTCSSDADPAVQNYHWYNADGGTLFGNSSVLHMNASRETTAVFCEAQNELGTENSNVTKLHVRFPPQILSSSSCTGDSSQIICVCDIEGYPFPLIQWVFPGESQNLSISSVPLSDRALRSGITVVKPQWKDSVTLVCHSSNFLGSDTKAFERAYETKAAGIWAGVTHPLLITLIVILLCLIGVLLFVVRTQIVRRKNWPANVVFNQIPTSNEERQFHLLMQA